MGTELQVSLCSGMCVANNLSTESHWNLTLLPRHARRQVSRQGSHKGLDLPCALSHLPSPPPSPEHLSGPCAGRLAPGRGGVSCSPHLRNYKEGASSCCCLSLPVSATHTPGPWTLGNAHVCLVSKEAYWGSYNFVLVFCRQDVGLLETFSLRRHG